MALETLISSHEYFPGSAMAPEPIPFPFLSKAEIRVTRVAASGLEVPMIAGLDFRISGDGSQSQASIVSLAQWPDGDRFLVERRTEPKQKAVIKPQEPFPAAAAESQLDRTVMLLQELRRDLDGVMTRTWLTPRYEDKQGQFAVILPGGLPGFASGMGADGSLRADLGAINGWQIIRDVAPILYSIGAVAATPSSRGIVFLNLGDRSGYFRWVSGDLSARVALDTRQGIYIPSILNTSGTLGAWVRVYSGAIDIRWFGATAGTAVGDQQPAIQCAIDVAQSARVHLPIGRWRLDQGLRSTLPMFLTGEGGAPGPGVVLNTNCTQLLANWPSGDVIFVNSMYASLFRDFQINSNTGTRTGGAGIHCSGDGLASTTALNEINNVVFNRMYEGIRMTRAVETQLIDTYHQAWATWAYIDETSGGFEAGGGFMRGNKFYGDTTPGTSQSGCLKMTAGYTWAGSNMVLGGQIGLQLDVSQHDVGFPSFLGISFEDQDVCQVLVTGSGGFTVSMGKFADCEFSSYGNRPNYSSCIKLDVGNYTLESFEITDCVFRCGGTFNPQFAFISLQKGNTVWVSNPKITSTAGTVAAAIVGGAGLGGGTVEGLKLKVLSGTCGRYSGLGQLQIFDRQGIPFAQAPACANGSEIYFTDGTPASPVVAGGTGCIADRINGAWRGN